MSAIVDLLKFKKLLGGKGADGIGVASAAISYLQGPSGTILPTGTWVSSPPATTKGQYLWTRTVTTYTDSSTSTAYSVAYQAIDGVGIPVFRYGDGLQLIQQTSLGTVSRNFTIPAGTVSGLNARFEVDGLFTSTNDTTTKAGTFSIGGQTVVSYTPSTTRGNPFRQSGMNRNALNSQVWVPLTANGGAGTNGQIGALTTNIDWTVDNTATVSTTLSGTLNGTPSITCEFFDFRVFN